ncbi:MAG: hypothetical protein Q9N02_01395 [Ghiorsea sp.]|nr:hypothetical protein [Ghiorsea sp.]
MNVKHVIVLVGMAVLLASCASNNTPLVYKHPETKSIVLLQGDTLQCEPLFRKAGFRKVETGAME